jgi:hypothetical protein
LPIDVDWEGIAEELEALAAAERDALKSRLEVVLEHLLKLRHVPMPEPRHGWYRTVREQRHRIDDLLETSPSLRPYLARVLDQANRRALRHVLADYRLRSVPERWPWTIEEILAEDRWPNEPDELREQPAAAG